ncbi:MAG: formylglycine-generating enzyme family protein [Treponema sp.]|nr:formylglycine-generating enzyme family protein [Treponema sp.]
MKKIIILFTMACFLVAGLAAQQNNMVRINGGTFTMGSPAGEVGHESDETQRQVTVSSFSISKYPVTVGEFRRFVNSANYRTQAERDGGFVIIYYDVELKDDANWRNPRFTQGDNHPVVLVSWFDAIEYCNWLSRQEGLTPAYTVSGMNVTWNRNANGYRFPTEAEWEYACRAGTTTPFNTGNNITTNQANYDGNYPYNNNAKGENRERTTPVGSFPANAWGLHDMHGNVWEWCWDWYGDYITGAQNNPTGAVSGSDRVIRGGSWSFYGRYLRSAQRYGYDPWYWYYDVGFRLVRP